MSFVCFVEGALELTNDQRFRIIWAITLVALVKYAIIALEFGNAGEGG